MKDDVRPKVDPPQIARDYVLWERTLDSLECVERILASSRDRLNRSGETLKQPVYRGGITTRSGGHMRDPPMQEQPTDEPGKQADDKG